MTTAEIFDPAPVACAARAAKINLFLHIIGRRPTAITCSRPPSG